MGGDPRTRGGGPLWGLLLPLPRCLVGGRGPARMAGCWRSWSHRAAWMPGGQPFSCHGDGDGSLLVPIGGCHWVGLLYRL